MTAVSQLQKAMNEAWPGIEKILAAGGDSEHAKALKNLKEAFVQRELPPTSTHLPFRGNWGDPDALPGLPGFPEVGGRKRTYEPDPEQTGLVELTASVNLSYDDLGGALPLKDGKVIDPAASKVSQLWPMAAYQQIDYSIDRLNPASATDGPTAALLAIVQAARASFGNTAEALTVLVDRQSVITLTDDEKKAVKRALTGGTLVELPASALADKALVLKRRPIDLVWYTAVDRQVGWGPLNLTTVRVSVVSRLVLDVPAAWQPYRATVIS